jgi:hypothetical protein
MLDGVCSHKKGLWLLAVVSPWLDPDLDVYPNMGAAMHERTGFRGGIESTMTRRIDAHEAR